MKNTAEIFKKVFVLQYYRSNATLFFLVLGFAGGFMRTQDHLALGELLITSQALLFVPDVIWILYATFTFNFNTTLLRQPENSFLIHYNLLKPTHQWSIVLWIAFLQLIPVFLYSLFLNGLAMKHHMYQSLLHISLSVSAIVVLSALLLKNYLHTFNTQKNDFQIDSFFRKLVTRRFVVIMIEGTLRQQTLALIGYKVAALLILWGTLLLYGTEDYDLRLLGIGTTVSFCLSISFIVEWHRFENSRFTLYKLMPFSYVQRLSYAVAILLIYFLPESLLIFRNWPETFSLANFPLIIAYGMSIGLLNYCFLYLKDRRIEVVIGYAYVAGIFFFVTILSKTPIILITTLNFAVAITFFILSYPRFQYSPDFDSRQKD